MFSLLLFQEETSRRSLTLLCFWCHSLRCRFWKELQGTFMYSRMIGCIWLTARTCKKTNQWEFGTKSGLNPVQNEESQMFCESGMDGREWGQLGGYCNAPEQSNGDGCKSSVQMELTVMKGLEQRDSDLCNMKGSSPIDRNRTKKRHYWKQMRSSILIVIWGTRKILRWIGSKGKLKWGRCSNLEDISRLSGSVQNFGQCLILEIRGGIGTATDLVHNVSPGSITNFRNSKELSLIRILWESYEIIRWSIFLLCCILKGSWLLLLMPETWIRGESGKCYVLRKTFELERPECILAGCGSQLFCQQSWLGMAVMFGVL